MPRIRETIAHRIEAGLARPLTREELFRDGYCKISEAADHTGISGSQIRRRIETGHIPYMREGKAVRVSIAGLEYYCTQRTVLRNDILYIAEGVIVVRERDDREHAA